MIPSSGSAMASAFVSAYCATSEPSTSSYEPALQFPVTPEVVPNTPSGGSQQDSTNIHMPYGDVTRDDAGFNHFNN